MNANLTDLIYLLSSVMFILGIKMLSSPKTAAQGNLVSALAMALAVGGTMAAGEIHNYSMIGVGALAGTLIGVAGSYWVKMTAIPQMVALYNGLGGASSALVALVEYSRITQAQTAALALTANGVAAQPSLEAQTAAIQPTAQTAAAPILGLEPMAALTIMLSLFVGWVTFTGSLVAVGKLQSSRLSRPMTFPLQNWFNLGLLAGVVVLTVHLTLNPMDVQAIILLTGLSLLMGVMVVIPIGGADMPVVVALLNSYSGIAVSFTGFVLANKVLIIVGALVGASGIFLTRAMCLAMNRSLFNVLFSAFGSAAPKKKAGDSDSDIGEIKPCTLDQAALMLEGASSVIIVPGFGMASAQAQHAVREVSRNLEQIGVDVRFAIHPVAGRMPGHMNVLLAEANVPYEQLLDLDQINDQFAATDVVLVVGANDVVNPAAREDTTSPLFGMPILNVDQSKIVIVLKRSMNPGFSGVENLLFYKDNTMMLFGDAKTTLTGLANKLKENL